MSLRRWDSRGCLPAPQNLPLKSSRSKAHTKAPPYFISFMYWTCGLNKNISQPQRKEDLILCLEFHPADQPSVCNACVLIATYLDLIALPAIKPYPLIVLAGIGHFLLINPLNGGALQEGADLKDKIKERPLDGSTVCCISFCSDVTS